MNINNIMADPVNYVIGPLESNINSGDPQGIKPYLQERKDIDKEADKLDISISNAKDIIDNFLGLVNKYGWGRLAFMVRTGVGNKNIFQNVYQTKIVDMHVQPFGYFGLQGIANLKKFLPNPLIVAAIKQFAQTPQEVQNIYDRVISGNIFKAIEG